MIVSRKAALSLLISTLIFAVFAAMAFTGLFNLVEARFYNPAVVRAMGREIDADVQVIEIFFDELWARFAATLEEGAVRRSLLAGLESEDITRRESLYRELLEAQGGLQSVRFIDSGGRRIQFSTWEPDILRRDRNYIAYRNYDSEENRAAYIPYRQIEATAPRLILDDTGERILFSLPYYDSFDVYRGTALFSLSVRAVMERLVIAGRIKVGEDVSVVSRPPGLVAGLPFAGRNVLLPLVARMWSENTLALGRLNADLAGPNLALISRKTAQNIYVGRLMDESLLVFPPAMRIILLVSLFVTMFLIIFLCFNFRQDDITILQSRLRKLQVKLLEEHYEHAGDSSWDRWKQELEHRREDIRAELKRGLHSSLSAVENVEIDAFIDRSWDDLMAIIGVRGERRSGVGEDMRTLLNRLLPETSRTALAAEIPEKFDALDEEDITEALEGPLEERTPPDSELVEFEIAEPDIPELEAVELIELEDAAPDQPEEPEALELEATEPEMFDEPEASELGTADLDLPEALELEIADLGLPSEPEASELETADLDLPGEPEMLELETADLDLSDEPEALELETADLDQSEEPEAPEIETADLDLPGEPEASELETADLDLPSEPGMPELETADLDLSDEPKASEFEAVEPDSSEEPEAPELETAGLDLPDGPELEAVDLDQPGEPEALELESVEPELSEKPEALELETAGLDLPDGPEALELEAVDLDLPSEPEALELEAVDLDLPSEPEALELEAVDLDLSSEPEAPELEAYDLDLPDEPETSAFEAVEPEMSGEPEAPEKETFELELPEELEARAKFRGFDSISGDSDHTTDMDDLMSAIEFGPDPLPEELDHDNENVFASMADLFDFESPATIFSSLSELEFTPEPMEDLESLERERTDPDDSLETEVEELPLSFDSTQFFTSPFLVMLNSELPLLMTEDGDATQEKKGNPETLRLPPEGAGDVITERDGVAYVSETALAPDEKTLEGLDRDFKALIDSVINDT